MQTFARLCDSEVDEARDAVVADEDVLRGHVAMHDPERLAARAFRLVRGVETVQRAEHDRHGVRSRERLELVVRAIRASALQSDGPAS